MHVVISGGTGTAAEKMAAFEAAGVPVARIPSEIPELIGAALSRRRKNGARPAAKRGAAKRGAAKRVAPKRAAPMRSAAKRAPVRKTRTTGATKKKRPARRSR